MSNRTDQATNADALQCHRDDVPSDDRRLTFRTRLCCFVRRLLGLSVVAIFVSGLGHAVMNPARHQSPQAAGMVGSLIAGSADPDDVPEDFDRQVGYRPAVEAETLVSPEGGCSVPGDNGAEIFDHSCRLHDLGYDALRYAEESDARLGAWARFEVDLLFLEDMLDKCETARCRATATAYYLSVTANSIRQGYKTPRAEPAVPWIGVFLAVVLVALMSMIRQSKSARRLLHLIHARLPGRLHRRSLPV